MCGSQCLKKNADNMKKVMTIKIILIYVTIYACE